MLVLGLDVSTRSTGWAIIKGDYQSIAHGAIRASSKNKINRQGILFNELNNIILEHKPDSIAIEDGYVGKFPNTAIILGEARGIAIASILYNGYTTYHTYTPSDIRKMVIGKGNASKENVAAILGAQYKLKGDLIDDITDAYAVATCHIYKERSNNYHKGEYFI